MLRPVVGRPRGHHHGVPPVLEGAVEPPGVVAAPAALGHARAGVGGGVQEGLDLRHDGLAKVVKNSSLGARSAIYQFCIKATVTQHHFLHVACLPLH